MYHFEFNRGLLTSIVLSMSVAVLASCSGSDSDDPETGVFIDSAVEGLYFITTSGHGTTDADGTFTYLPGEVVTFYIGDILIGYAEGQSILTPLDFVPEAEDASHPEVTNILRFLQSLDEDNNPDNGITISELTITQAESQTLDFELSEAEFETAANALLSVLTGGEVIELIDVADALEHFNGTGTPGGGGPSDLAFSGPDTALFGTSFTSDPAQTVVNLANPGSITWRQTMPDTSLLEVGVILFNGDINDVLVTWTNNSGSGPASTSHAISCIGALVQLFTPGDCSLMSIDTVEGEVVFDVTIDQSGLDGATAPLDVTGLLEF